MMEDTLLKRYFSDNSRFADLINGLSFDGAQIVAPEDLSDEDTQTGYHAGTEEAHSGKSRKKKRFARNTRYRDLVRRTAFGINFAIVGIENQKLVHYLMPLRVMDYDLAEYHRQASIIKRRIAEQKGLTEAEYLSKFTKADRLHPCVTFVLYYGEEWDGARDLHDIMDFSDIPPEFRNLVNNYHVNLIEIKKLKDTSVFKTDIRKVFDFIRCAGNKKDLRQLVENNPDYQTLKKDAYDVAVAFTGAEEFVRVEEQYKEGGEVNMCQALKEMLMDEREEGREEGRRQGVKSLVEVCKSLGATWEKAEELLAEKFQLSKEDTEQYMKMYW